MDDNFDQLGLTGQGEYDALDQNKRAAGPAGIQVKRISYYHSGISLLTQCLYLGSYCRFLAEG